MIVGCGQPNVRRTHEQARAAADLGADAILVNPPFYYPMTQDEVVSLFAAQHRANGFAVVFRSQHEFLPAAGKAALSRLGLMEKWVAPPKTPLPEDEAGLAFEAVKSFLPEFESQ